MVRMLSAAAPWRRLPWGWLVFLLGVAGSVAASLIAGVLVAIIGRATSTISESLIFAALVLPALIVVPVGLVFTIAALLGAWFGRELSARAELIAIPVGVLGVTAALSWWMSTWYGGELYALGTAIGGLLAAAGFTLLTRNYRAVPYDRAGGPAETS